MTIALIIDKQYTVFMTITLTYVCKQFIIIMVNLKGSRQTQDKKINGHMS